MAHKYKDVIIAWANGEEIQFASTDKPNSFYDYCNKVHTPNFDLENLIWRIKPKNTYCIGDKFRDYYNSGIYLLAAIADEHVCALININTGFRLGFGMIVNDPYYITEEEFNQISLGKRMIPVQMSEEFSQIRLGQKMILVEMTAASYEEI